MASSFGFHDFELLTKFWNENGVRGRGKKEGERGGMAGGRGRGGTARKDKEGGFIGLN